MASPLVRRNHTKKLIKALPTAQGGGGVSDVVAVREAPFFLQRLQVLSMGRRLPRPAALRQELTAHPLAALRSGSDSPVGCPEHSCAFNPNCP